MAGRTSDENAIWRSGLLWAVWHYPFTIYFTWSAMRELPAAATFGLPPIAMAATVIPALAGHTMSLIGMTYLYAWLYNHTNSVFLCILFHGLTNTVNALAFAAIETPQMLTLAVALMPWAVVVVLQRMLGRSRFPGGSDSVLR